MSDVKTTKFTECVSYKTRVIADKRLNQLMRLTLKEYHRFLATITPIIEENWEQIEDISSLDQRMAYAEHLFHHTKKNPNPQYPQVDDEFPNLPSYLRRSGIRAVLGNYQSYVSNYANWINAGKQGKPPKISYHPHNAPSFYKGNMIKYPQGEENIQHLYIKLYNGVTWDYYPIKVRKQDANYINKHSALPGWKLLCPVLQRKGKNKWLLRFTFSVECQLRETPIEEQRVCAVDLGVNTDATCCIMDADGTVVARRFINFAADKAKMYHLCNKIRKAQSQGARKLKKKWGKVNSINDELVSKIANEILDFAIEYSCSTIACEYLEFKGKLSGSRKQRLHLWRKRALYHRLVGAAHRWGIRVRQVCAWGTSKLASDGSGKVQRGKYIVDDQGNSLGLGYAWVRFSSGKLLNADLNAAYNIGARYFVRELSDAA